MKNETEKIHDFNYLIAIGITAFTLCLCSCSNTKLHNRPQVIYSNRDSSFVLIKGNANHFQQRAYYKAKKLAEKSKLTKNK